MTCGRAVKALHNFGSSECVSLRVGREPPGIRGGVFGTSCSASLGRDDPTVQAWVPAD